MTGKLIVIEGVDGSGKSTQAKLLFDYLTELGKDVILTREPGGSSFGNKIREILITEELDELEKLFLFLTARAKHIRETVKPALDVGKIVICDRYIYSTHAYQHDVLYNGMHQETIQDLITEIPTRNVLPDIVLYLNISIPECLRRLANKSDKNILDREDKKYIKKLKLGYEVMFDGFFSSRTKFIKINGEKNVSKVHKDIITNLKKENII